jgi:hypothetical protein
VRRSGGSQEVPLLPVRHVGALVGNHRAGVVGVEVVRSGQTLEDLSALALANEALEDPPRRIHVAATTRLVSLDDPGVDRRISHREMVARPGPRSVPLRRHPGPPPPIRASGVTSSRVGAPTS